MNDTPSPALLAAVAADDKPSDKLDALRAACEAFRGDVLLIAGLEEELKRVKLRYNERTGKVIPDMMTEAGVTGIDLDAAGNLPAVRVELKPYYSANIAASWEPARRDAAFQALEGLGEGDLIKTTVVIAFPREARKDAQDLVDGLKKMNINAAIAVDERVSSQTLTAWVKERSQRNMPLPPLDVIGASIGRVAVVKERKGK